MLLTGQAGKGSEACRRAGFAVELGRPGGSSAAERALVMAVFADRQVICSNEMVRWSR
jgi:hypothetical protein